MAVFSSLVAVFAVFNVALASTDFSSAVSSSSACFTSTVTVSTAVTVTAIVTASTPASSSVLPPSSVVPVPEEPTFAPSFSTPAYSAPPTGVVSVPEQPSGSQICSTIMTSMHGSNMAEVQCTAAPGISVSIIPGLPSTTATASAAPSQSVVSSTKTPGVITAIPPPLLPTLVFSSTIAKNSTTIVPSKTGGASVSASHSAPPEFTAAAAGINVGAAAIFGGVVMALFA